MAVGISVSHTNCRAWCGSILAKYINLNFGAAQYVKHAESRLHWWWCFLINGDRFGKDENDQFAEW